MKCNTSYRLGTTPGIRVNASAIATGLAQGMEIEAAIERARNYVMEAIRTAPGFGRGHGPLNHAHTVKL